MSSEGVYCVARERLTTNPLPLARLGSGRETSLHAAATGPRLPVDHRAADTDARMVPGHQTFIHLVLEDAADRADCFVHRSRLGEMNVGPFLSLLSLFLSPSPLPPPPGQSIRVSKLCRCKNLSVNCFLAAATQPLRVRWSEGERSEPSGTEPAGVGFCESVVVGGPRGACVGVFNKNILHPSPHDPPGKR